jgi:hypothetical protein
LACRHGPCKAWVPSRDVGELLHYKSITCPQVGKRITEVNVCRTGPELGQGTLYFW